MNGSAKTGWEEAETLDEVLRRIMRQNVIAWMAEIEQERVNELINGWPVAKPPLGILRAEAMLRDSERRDRVDRLPRPLCSVTGCTEYADDLGSLGGMCWDHAHGFVP